MSESKNLPIVMCFSGNDPSGGAGMTADIETIISHGGHAVPIITCLTVQDTVGVIGIVPVESQLLVQQARTVLEDLPVDAIKIGLTGNEENIQAIYDIITDYPDIPVVLDPIIESGGNGAALSTEDMVDMMLELLIPESTVVTPNSQEILQIIPEADNAHAASLALLETGCEFVLTTGTHENTPEVINRLYGDAGELKRYKWPRLQHTYHGSGCTLSSAIASLLAQQEDIETAIENAQDYTWRSLNEGYRLGMGQHHPNRLFWANDGEDKELGTAT